MSTECKNVMCGVLTDSNNKFEIWMEYIQLCFKTGRFGSARDTLTKAVSALSVLKSFLYVLNIDRAMI